MAEILAIILDVGKIRKLILTYAQRDSIRFFLHGSNNLGESVVKCGEK